MKRIFILEDSKTDAHRLKTLLKNSGYEVVGIAESGAEAIEKVAELKPDLVFVDIILKGWQMDGVEAASEIRKNMDVPIIFVTHYSDEKVVDRALKVSPYAYIIKPIDEDQLRVTLETTKQRLRLEKEREDLVGQLYQSQKMEAIGQLAGGMAHNFNNILNVMIGNAELALKNLSAKDPNKEKMSRIVRSGIRARDLTMKLLALSRKEKLYVRTVDVNEIIGDVLDILKGSVSKKIRIETRLEEKSPAVRADLNQVIQAVLNVCMNACDAMPEGGTLSIENRVVLLDEYFCREETGLVPGEYVLIRIKDTGRGIPKEIMDKVFEPFFTTKEKKKGTGLGLYVTQNIIRGHNGCIEIDSEENNGTVADIYLPVLKDAAAPEAEKKKEAKTPAGNNETILIIDDEEDFLDLVAEILQFSGYRTLKASGGKKALELYLKHSGEISLVLLDMMMPEMDGGEVFHALKKINSGVKVVICSGFSSEGKAGELMKEGVAAFVQKPFVVPELESAISNALSA